MRHALSRSSPVVWSSSPCWRSGSKKDQFEERFLKSGDRQHGLEARVTLNVNPGPIRLSSSRRDRAGGFTLIELLVVIGILVLLASILIPTIAHVRTSVHQANTASRVVALTNAIENYFHTFNAYPGPAADGEIMTTALPTQPKLLGNTAKGNAATITGTENLTLALVGGLRLIASTPGGALDTANFVPDEVGKGALGLNPNKPAQRYGPFVEPKIGGLDTPLSKGGWTTWNDKMHPGGTVAEAAGFGDTIIPEFVDAYPDALPILYIRATLGAGGSILGAKDTSGNVVTSAAYDPGQLQYYVFPALTSGSMQSPAPWIVNNAFSSTSSIDPQVLADFNQTSASPPISPANYFGQYLAPAVPRSKGYLLITAGPDRKYMTKDDTINNGSAVK